MYRPVRNSPFYVVILYAAPMLVFWSVYLLALWPGLMSPDSMDQWRQAMTGSFNDHHPAFHTILISLLINIKPTPAVVAVIQIVGLSTIAALFLYELDRWGLPRPLLVLASIIFALSPPNSALSITLWKDVAYTIAFLSFCLIILKIILSNGEWLDSIWHLITLSAVTVLVAIFRHNGLLVSFVSLILLTVGFRKYIKNIAITVGLALALLWLIKVPLYNNLKVTRSDTTALFMYIQELHYISAHLAAGTPLTDSEADLIFQMTPRAVLKKYNCLNSGWFIYSPRTDHSFIRANAQELHKIFFALSRRAPLVSLRHFVCASALIWKISASPEDSDQLMTIPVEKAKGQWKTISNPAVVVPSSKLPELKVPLLEFLMQSQSASYQWFVWCPAMYLYLLIFTVLTLVFRYKHWQFIYLLLPALLHTFILSIVIGSQDFRYQYPIYTLALLTWPLMFLRKTTFVLSDQDHHAEKEPSIL